MRFDAAGNGSELTGPSCATTAVAGAPRAIEDLQPMADGGRLTLHWTASGTPGVIYLVTVDGGASLGASGEPSFRVVGLKPGERRCFQVTAQDPSGRESPRSQEICVAGPGGVAAPAGEPMMKRTFMQEILALDVRPCAPVAPRVEGEDGQAAVPRSGRRRTAPGMCCAQA